MESVCIVCQAHTDLVPLGEFENLYELLAGNNKFVDQKLSTCLSCQDFFGKIKEFQGKIQSAQEVLLAHFNHFIEPKDDIAVNQVKQEAADEFNYEDYEYPEDNFTNEVVPILKETPDTIIHKFEIDKSILSLNDNKLYNSDIVIREVNVKNKPETVKRKYLDRRKPWTDEKIKAFIKKHNFPYDIKYVKKLLDCKYMKYKVVHGQELYENCFDALVEMQVCVDDNEIKEMMQRSRRQRRLSSRKTVCKKCVWVFNGKKELRKHVEEKHAKTIGPYKCEFCEIRTVNKESLETHRQTHYNKYVCKLCQDVECGKEQMLHHFQAKGKMFQCLECQQMFGDKAMLQHHYKATHMTYICDHCQKIYHDRLWFEKHVIDHHLPNRCQHCPKVYRDHIRLLKHIQQSHAEAEPTYCVECDRTYPDRARFQQHVYMQHGPRKPATRHPCQECGASFFSKFYLKNHTKHVHLKQTSQCDICSKLFSSKYHLKTHIKSVHEKVRLPKNKICMYCGRGFSTARVLTNHIRTHTGEKPYVCAVCDAAFAQKIALQMHLKRHVK